MHRYQLLFLDLVLVLLLVALSIFQVREKPQEQNFMMVKSIQSDFKYNGTITNIQDEVSLGLSYEVDGIPYDETAYNDKTKVIASAKGFALFFTDVEPPSSILIVTRELGNNYTRCILDTGCKNPTMDVVCHSDESVAHVNLNQGNRLVGTCGF